MKISLKQRDEEKELGPLDPVAPEVPAEGTETLPPASEPEIIPSELPVTPETPNPTESLKVEIAELRGELRGIRGEAKPSPVDDQELRDAQTKQTIFNDIDALEDDDFRNKYKSSKVQVANQVNQYDLNKEKTKNAQMRAEFEAKNDLITKYPSFSKYSDKIKSVLSDLSPEARQDSSRVKKAMEREFIFLSGEEEKTRKSEPAKETSVDRKRISSDFAKPSLNSAQRGRSAEGQDLIAEEDRELAAHFGITSESQRKKFSSPFIPMDFGVDPKDGKRWVFDGTKKEPYKVANP